VLTEYPCNVLYELNIKRISIQYKVVSQTEEDYRLGLYYMRESCMYRLRLVADPRRPF